MRHSKSRLGSDALFWWGANLLRYSQFYDWFSIFYTSYPTYIYIVYTYVYPTYGTCKDHRILEVSVPSIFHMVARLESFRWCSRVIGAMRMWVGSSRGPGKTDHHNQDDDPWFLDSLDNYCTFLWGKWWETISLCDFRMFDFFWNKTIWYTICI